MALSFSFPKRSDVLFEKSSFSWSCRTVILLYFSCYSHSKGNVDVCSFEVGERYLSVNEFICFSRSVNICNFVEMRNFMVIGVPFDENYRYQYFTVIEMK